MDTEKEMTWHGYRCDRFLYEGKEAIIVFPKDGTANGNWAVKTEYWDAFPDTEIRLLENGFHIAYLKNETRFATEEECARKARFIKDTAEKYGLKSKCALIGMSCGGAHAVNLAGYYPEVIACLYIDAPVLNFCDFPGRLKDQVCESVFNNEFTRAYPGIRRSDLLSFPPHPLNRAKRLIECNIPILMVYGVEDSTVNYDLNGKLLEDAYSDTEGLLTVIAVKCRGHHPHELIFNKERIAEYIISKCNEAE